MGKNKQFRSLEDSLSLAATMSQKGPVSLDRIIKIFSHKTEYIILLILSILALSLASISFARIIIGCLAIYIGVCIGCGFTLYLPEFLLQKKFPRRFFVRFAKLGVWSVKKMRRFTRPRLEKVCHHKIFRILNSSLVVLLGVTFIISTATGIAPILLAISLFLLALGLLEDDGFLMIFGYIEAVTAFVYLLL